MTDFEPAPLRLPRLLCVDDEPEVLASLRVTLRKKYKVTVAESGPAALALFSGAGDGGSPFDVVVSDMRMPQMSGAELLAELRRRFPDMPRLLLSGQADLDSTISAINEAKIARFLTKPCDTADLIEAIDDALEVARLARAERELLDRTLNGTVGLLTEVLGLISVAAYGRTQRLETLVTHLSAALHRPVPWDLALAAKLSQLGYLVVHDELASDAGAHAAEVTAGLLANIPRMDSVAWIISHQTDAGPVAEGGDVQRWPRRAVSAEILRLAAAFDALTSGGASPREAHAAIAASPAPPPRMLLDAVSALRLDALALVEACVTVRQLAPGMHLAQDVVAASGVKLAAAGTVLNGAMIGRIRSFQERVGLPEPIQVRVPEARMHQLDAAAGPGVGAG
ncbi:MAG: response regulator [Acidimicrobiales bacterium]